MAIARAIERITTRAKQGGVIAVLTGLGEELRGQGIPAPLRRAAHLVATLLDGKRPALDTPATGGSAGGPAITVNVAVAVAVGADPSDPEKGSDSSDRPVVATAVAMSPGASSSSGTEDAQPSADPHQGEEARDDPETAGEVAWRSGLAPRAEPGGRRTDSPRP